MTFDGCTVASGDDLHTCNRSLWAVMDALPAEVKGAADHLAVDGMSATALLVDARTGAQLAAPMLYNESQPAEVVAAVKVRTLARWRCSASKMWS